MHTQNKCTDIYVNLPLLQNIDEMYSAH